MTQERNCKRKKRMNKTEAKQKATKRKMDYYNCPICNGWHLTKRKKQ